MPKIKYGVHDCWFAKATIAENGSATYGTVNTMPGARSWNVDPDGETTNYYADDKKYYVEQANNGYTGDMTFAMLPEVFLTEILGMLKDSKNNLFEDPDVQTAHFAFGGIYNTDAKKRKFVFYNVVASRPADNHTTKERTISPDEDVLSVECSAVYNTALNKWITKLSTTEETSDADYEAFDEEVYQPTALG